jgi:hypothetical protein
LQSFLQQIYPGWQILKWWSKSYPASSSGSHQQFLQCKYYKIRFQADLLVLEPVIPSQINPDITTHTLLKIHFGIILPATPPMFPKLSFPSFSYQNACISHYRIIIIKKLFLMFISTTTCTVHIAEDLWVRRTHSHKSRVPK